VLAQHFWTLTLYVLILVEVFNLTGYKFDGRHYDVLGNLKLVLNLITVKNPPKAHLL
jgi:hypothetical protein